MNNIFLLETKDFLVINKPPGISVHGDGKSDQYTVADWVLENHPDLAGVGEEVIYNGQTVKRPGIVHRLDKETSGVLILAKNQEAYLHLKKQFQEHTLKKEYHAVVYGSIKADTFSVTEPIGRSGGDIRKWATGRNARGTLRDAETTFHVLARYGVENQKASTEDGTYSYVACFPRTGRTHQIRVHLKSVNHPIVSDILYAPKREKAFGFGRCALHAYMITFFDLENKEITITAPFPEDFAFSRVAFGL